MNFISLDQKLFFLINSQVGRWPILDSIARLLVNEYFVPVTLSLLLVYLWFKAGKKQTEQRKALPLAFWSVILVNLSITVVNFFIVRDRPFEQVATKLLFYRPTDPSFPSNSTAVGFALATAILMVNKKAGIFALVLATLYGLSRVYVGVHFPSDVLAGALIGIIASVLVGSFGRQITFLVNLLSNWQRRLKLKVD